MNYACMEMERERDGTNCNEDESEISMKKMRNLSTIKKS